MGPADNKLCVQTFGSSAAGVDVYRISCLAGQLGETRSDLWQVTVLESVYAGCYLEQACMGLLKNAVDTPQSGLFHLVRRLVELMLYTPWARCAVTLPCLRRPQKALQLFQSLQHDTAVWKQVAVSQSV